MSDVCVPTERTRFSTLNCRIPRALYCESSSILCYHEDNDCAVKLVGFWLHKHSGITEVNKHGG